jgi:hypothetical protein
MQNICYLFVILKKYLPLHYLPSFSELFCIGWNRFLNPRAIISLNGEQVVSYM